MDNVPHYSRYALAMTYDAIPFLYHVNFIGRISYFSYSPLYLLVLLCICSATEKKKTHESFMCVRFKEWKLE